MASFENLGLSKETLKVIKNKGFETPTPIQEQTIPKIILGNKDIIGQAQTGTGKTAAFGLPLIELLKENSKSVQAIILAPTRELAIQVAEEINSLKGNKRLSIVPIYGGQSMDTQLRSLRKGVDIVVGTPGRVLDHLRRKTLKLDKITHFVLDEADEMLNMGFLEDMQTIMKCTPDSKRTMLFSATMPPEILKIAKKYMREYVILKVSYGALTISQTDQIYFEVAPSNKFEALCRIIDIEEGFYALIFCRTKVDVDTVANRLAERGYDAAGMHGDMSQNLREKILTRFKKKKVNIVVATDVAARGIDVQDLTHVINFSLPQDTESYVHRIGRTGRAGKEGTAITFITPAEYRRLHYISKQVKTNIRKEKLPKVEEVIKLKKKRIASYLKEIIAVQPKKEYIKMTADLLEDNDPQAVIAALLEHSFKGELDEKRYVEIDDAKVDSKGTTRLFVGQGRSGGLTPGKLAGFIQDKCRISNDKINAIQVLEKFSFVTLPFNDAEKLLDYLKKSNQKDGLHITKAKEDKSQSRRRGRNHRRR